MYFNINTSTFQDVPSVPALLSLAEMLYSKSPEISGVFVNYASKLVQNQLARTGSRPDRDAAFAALQGQAQQLKLPSPKTVEIFANSLVASANGQFADDFYKIAYLAYASLSIYGPLTNSVKSRLANVQSKIGSQGYQQQAAGGPPQFNPNQAGSPPAFNPQGSAAGGPPVFTPYGNIPGTVQGGPPAFTPQGGPPAFTPASQGGPPVFTPQGGPPAFTPAYSGGPPAFTPQGGPPSFNPTSAGGPPVFTPQGGPPAFTPNSGGPPVFTPQGAPPTYGQTGFVPIPGVGSYKPQISDKAAQLMKLAHKSFQAGQVSIAYSALMGAIKELEK